VAHAVQWTSAAAEPFTVPECKRLSFPPSLRFSQSHGTSLCQSSPAKSCCHTALSERTSGASVEQRARLVNAIARGRRWLDEIVEGSVIDADQLA
jgi:hypothetical protein